MGLSPKDIQVYHVFLASPGDLREERQQVRRFFDRYNGHTAQLWRVRFEVVDWENYATVGAGRPQELITAQTLERFRDSLALVIGIMGQRFGSPTGEAESGTEEEFNWALKHYQQNGSPEIKWFFRRVDHFTAPPDPDEAQAALEQWRKVRAFRQRLDGQDPRVFVAEYPAATGFRDVFEEDLNRWLAHPDRPWIARRQATAQPAAAPVTPPTTYYECIERDFHRLDIAGIDNERTFDIPLSEIYVRLRVMFDEDSQDDVDELPDAGPIDVQTALLRYSKLVIVGDPGSGKSTFLKYIALMLARSVLAGNPAIARDRLCLDEPLPIPVFLSCWDLADFLKRCGAVRLDALVEFVVDRLTAFKFPIAKAEIEALLESGSCCLLFDGLDEVPTDQGRAAVSRLLEECVATYGRNRFVVTSRVRAYTGATILTGQFTRCDIQPFDAADRAEFVRNWVALLFGVPLDQAFANGTPAKAEYDALCHGIEASDRILALAVNPLLLTVIAIVHWNRKRLPEQRVELYDECIDVLLGQRKEAEHIQITRKVDALDERREEQQHEERSWTRKRFAEIALEILCLEGDRDEVTKAEVVKLLTPRFIDQGAENEDQAASRAEVFLDRQEIRSGLLVSRRAHSYRFVHLTFQEYLAAWNLSNQEFDRVAALIQPRLRTAKWFETLQLLGGEWGKHSDEKLDRYLAWLLNQQGRSIKRRAPLVALCANIVKDTSGVAELTPKSRQLLQAAVKATLDAFGKGSGVPVKTQLEILEALGQLGAAVKRNLIDATKASLFQVRRRAIKMLLPHLSDDELFNLDHILQDGSREPVVTYLVSLLDRDADRAATLLQRESQLREQVGDACNDLLVFHSDRLSAAFCRAVATLAPRGHVRSKALWELVEKSPDEATRELIEARAVDDDSEDARSAAIRMLAKKWPDEPTRRLIERHVFNDSCSETRKAAIEALGKNWPDEATRKVIETRAVKDRHSENRKAAIQALAEKWPDEATRKLLLTRAVEDPVETVRNKTFFALAQMHSKFGGIVVTDYRYPYPFYRDPLKPIMRRDIERAAKKAKIKPAQVAAQVASLSEFLGWDITRGAGAGRRKRK